MAETNTIVKPLRPVQRFITAHNTTTGEAIFSSAVPEPAPVDILPGDAHFTLLYTTSGGFPVQFNDDRDIPAYQAHLATPPGITISNGSVCRIVDMHPGATSPMHRTVSLDYGVVIEGEIELVLDSGETRRLKRGDVAVQRGTNHAWRNVASPTDNGGWSRMLFVLLPAGEVELEDGRKLAEDRGGIPVRASD